MKHDPPVAVVAGIGPGLGAALVRRLSADGYAVAGLARQTEFARQLAGEVSASAGSLAPFACDVSDPEQVRRSFADIRRQLGRPAVLIYNAGAFARGALTDTPVEEFDRLWSVNCRGAFLCAREAVPDMLAAGSGTILFTGATAAVKPGADFSAFGSSKFALRGLAQGMARELAPQGIHVAHVIIDGVIWTPRTREMAGVTAANTLEPDAIAETYLQLIRQHRSAWTWELDLRPDVEPF
ncbi:MAG: SDR family NAD(P)-dependent oxidoreductase [Gammaproteobacteria bacterium]